MTSNLLGCGIIYVRKKFRDMTPDLLISVTQNGVRYECEADAVLRSIFRNRFHSTEARPQLQLELGQFQFFLES